jgi:hypothetical protein
MEFILNIMKMVIFGINVNIKMAKEKENILNIINI